MRELARDAAVFVAAHLLQKPACVALGQLCDGEARGSRSADCLECLECLEVLREELELWGAGMHAMLKLCARRTCIRRQDSPDAEKARGVCLLYRSDSEEFLGCFFSSAGSPKHRIGAWTAGKSPGSVSAGVWRCSEDAGVSGDSRISPCG